MAPKLRLILPNPRNKNMFELITRQQKDCVEQIKQRATILQKWGKAPSDFMSTEYASIMESVAETILNAISVLEEYQKNQRSAK